ncbi:MAG TPA: hypothetical protein PLR99_20060 [Polyangiaceae bacterium]|jgi:hypothetical protein|nr:hypothetical protein [Polyangiaceae bacterium]
MVRLASVLVGLALFASACATPRAEDPQSVLRAYATALEQGRSDEAYRLLSDDARRGISLEAFRRILKDNPDEVREIGRALARPTSAPLVTATVTGGDGEQLVLVLENGKWKLDPASLDFYAQDTPKHVVMGFVRALERRRFDVVLRYIPDAHREGFDAERLKKAWEGPDKEEMLHVLTALKQALPTAAIEETGDRATMPYGAGTLQLVRERGLWKIEDFD